MKKIQSKYLLWALIATFSLNVGVPVLAAEPKQEKLTFAQRIKLLRRAKEWLKETNELERKIRAGTATKEEKKRYAKRVIGINLILLLLVGIPFVWFARKKTQELKERAMAIHIADLAEIEKEWFLVGESGKINEAIKQFLQRTREEKVREYYNLKEAALVRREYKTRAEALEAIQRDLQQDLPGERSKLLGSPRERAEALFEAAMKKEEELKKLGFDILDVGEREPIENIMKRMEKAKKVGSPRSLR